MRIAIVCLGNICRSPMAETVAATLVEKAGLAGSVRVESFGTAGYHIGDPADPRGDAALARGGWPPRRHKVRQLTAADVAGADLVLCADRANLAAVRRLAGEGVGRSSKVRLLRSYDSLATPGDDEVPDPYHGADAEFDATLAIIERSCRRLVDDLADARR
ncbi:MAG TPA: low molecular weight protein-tyrosine-phosphatase [Acidimicrobiales bacterium]|nr:low molecular weight protein-tyrosine-phosphatase [Acidimicrobiales bacterium]